MSDPRKRIDERALEKEEEDYFNEDRFAYLVFQYCGYILLILENEISMILNLG